MAGVNVNNVRIEQLYDTTENWEKVNPLLLKGEIGVEVKSDTELKIKVGDGISHWNALDYATMSIVEINQIRQNLQEQINNIVIESSGDSPLEVVAARTSETKTYDTLKERLDASDTVVNNLATNVKSNTSALETANAKIDQEATKRAEEDEALNLKIDDVQAQATANSAAIETLNKDMPETISEIHEAINSVRETANTNEISIDKCNSDITALQEEVKNLDSTLDYTINSLNGAIAQVEENKTNIATLQTDVDGNKREITNLNAAVDHIQDELATTVMQTIGSNTILATSANNKADTALSRIETTNVNVKSNRSRIAVNETTLGYSGKNLLKVTVSTQTRDGITYTINDDKSITASGTQSLQTNTSYFAFGTFTAPFDGEYILTGYPTTDTSVDTNLGYLQYGATVIRDLEHKLTMSKGETIHLMLCVKAKCTLENRVFIPMVRLADITDSTYEPYIENVDERITNNDSDIAINKSTLGYTKKNLLPPTNSVTRAGITYTVAENGKVILTGANASSSYNYFSIPVTLKAGKYIISGMPSGGAINTYRVDLRSEQSSGTMFGYGATPFEVEISETTTVYYMIRIDSSYKSELNLTFEPMIRHADITDDTYEPYVEDVDTRLKNIETNSGVVLASGIQSGTATITNLSKYKALWVDVAGNVSGIKFETNLIVPVAHLAKSTSNIVKLAGGIPSSAYITSEGVLAAKDMNGYITATVNGDVLELSMTEGTVAINEVISLM